MNKKDPYLEGRYGFRFGEICGLNPYPIGSVSWNLWNDGYADEKGEPNSPWFGGLAPDEVYAQYEQSLLSK